MIAAAPAPWSRTPQPPDLDAPADAGSHPAVTLLLRARACALLAGVLFEDVVRHGHAWVFVFGRDALTVDCPWRLVDGGALVLAAHDHGQRLDGRTAFDAVDEARRRLLGRKVVEAQLAPDTADLSLLIEGGARLEAFADSAAFEAWRLDRAGFAVAAAGGRLIEARAARSLG
jgi:hypothetical protein